MSTAAEASPPTPPAARRESSRALDVLTAVLLGVVSLTTALGAWQATTWTRQAADYGESSADARDQNITRSIDWQASFRLDNAAVFQARKFALQEDEAIASGDVIAAAYSSLMVDNYLGRSVNGNLPAAFDGWRADGFPLDEAPTSDPGYVAELRGDADSYSIVSALAGGFKDDLQTKASIFTQAALVDALALFLLGVAGINRLRSARFATLALGTAAYLTSLVMMAAAY
ncbi:MAG: hypothetical protein ABL886_01400 [Rhodoglobus sp.]